MNWPPPELEAEYRATQEREDREGRKGALWALLIVSAASGCAMAWILSL